MNNKNVLKKYESIVSNTEWHIRVNKPPKEEIKKLNKQLEIYKEVIHDFSPEEKIKEPSIKEDIEKLADEYSKQYDGDFDDNHTEKISNLSFIAGYKAALQSLPIKSGADKMIEEIENIQEKESKEICPICGEFKDVCGCWHIKNTPINEVKQPIQGKVSDDELIEKFRPLVNDWEDVRNNFSTQRAAILREESSIDKIGKCIEISKSYSNTKLDELEKWINETCFEIIYRRSEEHVGIDMGQLKVKINTLK